MMGIFGLLVAESPNNPKDIFFFWFSKKKKRFCGRKSAGQTMSTE